MGADIFKETDQGETAADLATRCGGVKEMIQILRAAEGKDISEKLHPGYVRPIFDFNKTIKRIYFLSQQKQFFIVCPLLSRVIYLST